jgi:ribosome-associated protein
LSAKLHENFDISKKNQNSVSANIKSPFFFIIFARFLRRNGKLMNQTKKLVDTIVKGLQEKKGHYIVTVDLREMSGAICQYMVVCEGNNPHQVAALSDSVWDTVYKDMSEKPLLVEGIRNAQWIGMDYGTVLVHIFLPGTRTFYRIENLWEDAVITRIDDNY